MKGTSQTSRVRVFPLHLHTPLCKVRPVGFLLSSPTPSRIEYTGYRILQISAFDADVEAGSQPAHLRTLLFFFSFLPSPLRSSEPITLIQQSLTHSPSEADIPSVSHPLELHIQCQVLNMIVMLSIKSPPKSVSIVNSCSLAYCNKLLFTYLSRHTHARTSHRYLPYLPTYQVIHRTQQSSHPMGAPPARATDQ